MIVNKSSLDFTVSNRDDGQMIRYILAEVHKRFERGIKERKYPDLEYSRDIQSQSFIGTITIYPPSGKPVGVSFRIPTSIPDVRAFICQKATECAIQYHYPKETT